MGYVVGAKYEDDKGIVHPIRISSAFYTAAGTPPTGDIDSEIKAKIYKSDREFGLGCRGARLARVVGTAPNTFAKYSFVPILTASQYNTGTFVTGGTVTINSVEWTIISLKPEDY